MNKVQKHQQKMFSEIDNLFQKGNINEIGFARCIWLMLSNNYITSCMVDIEELSNAEIIYLRSYGCKVEEKNDEILISL